MADMCRFTVLIIVALDVLKHCESYDLQRLSERIDKMELRILTEGMYAREDIHELQETVERIETRLNLTYEDAERLLNETVILEGLEVSVAQLMNFKIVSETKMGNISDSLNDLRDSLELDKTLGENTRRHVADIDRIISSFKEQSQRVSDSVYAILTGLKLLSDSISKVPLNQTKYTDDRHYSTSCLDSLREGRSTSGVITILPGSNEDTLMVYCDQETDGGGWTVFQRRQDGTVDFYRTWDEYKDGFGYLRGEFWLGNVKIHRLLSLKSRFELRIDMMDYNNNTAYAKYGSFMIGPESEKFKLTAGEYTGDAGDSLGYHNGCNFSTRDLDNDVFDKSCAVTYKGAWWYRVCYYSNLNGLYSTNGNSGINWRGRFVHNPLKFVEMKFREHAAS